MIRFVVFFLLCFSMLNVASSWAQSLETMVESENLPLLEDDVSVEIVPSDNAEQDSVLNEESVDSAQQVEGQMDGLEQSQNKNFDPSDYPSLLLTNQEYLAIIDARNSRGLVRPASDSEQMIDGAAMGEEQSIPMPPPEERYIRLGGILYKSPDSWTIWLNGARVTPDALPLEVIDFSVKKDYIEMKWFDEYTRQIIPIRLRANQRFHIDTRMFLPG